MASIGNSRKDKAAAYEQRTLHSRNPLARLSHRARLLEAMAAVMQALPAEGTMLDFGCAQGQLLNRVHAARPRARLYGIDPLQQQAIRNYTHLRSIPECDGMSFDVITAFEVLEHLSEPGADAFFGLVRRCLSSGGFCVISVPNMLGPALLPKLLHGVLHGGSAREYTSREALAAAVLLRGPSRVPPGKSGTMRHKGYDWRKTRARIAHEFEVIAEKVTPLPWLWWGFNSQWFCTFRNR